MAGRFIVTDVHVISATMPGFLQAFNYISTLKWGTSQFIPKLSDDRRGNDCVLAGLYFPLYSLTTFSSPITTGEKLYNLNVNTRCILLE